MPNATITTLAQSVTDLLNNASLSQTFTASRCYSPVYDTSTNPGLKVFVIGAASTTDLVGGTRSENVDVNTIVIGIFNKVARDDNGNIDATAMDAMTYFVWQIKNLLIAATITGANLNRIVNELEFDPTELSKYDTFRTSLTCEFMVYE